MLVIKIILLIVGVILLFISLYGMFNRKKIIEAVMQAKRDLNENDSGLLITHGVTRRKPGERGLKSSKKLSKFYMDTI